jgi:hypothetical protein
MNLLLCYIYTIICSIFYINQHQNFFWVQQTFNTEILILINFGEHQHFQREDSDHDQV